MLDSERVMLMELGRRVVREGATGRNAIGDSDLYGEQPVIVTVKATLGELRTAGLHSVPGYTPE